VPPWTPVERFAFRVASLYLGLFCLAYLLYWIPGMAWLDNALIASWDWLVPRVGAHVLGITEPIPTQGNGSGDRLFDYVWAFTRLAIAVVGAGVWSAVDGRRREYARAHEALRVLVRYTLASVMLGYGFAKVFKTQFADPSPVTLLEPYGEASPMGLMWTFMGYSLPYNVFTGGLEVLGGVLLLWRRTTTLGALLAAAVMAHVAVLNFSYDVPLKLNSTHLVALAVLLLLPDARRLADFFLFNRATAPAPVRPPLPSPWLERARLGVKALFVLWLVGSSGWQDFRNRSTFGDGAPKHPLHGAYVVEGLQRAGRDVPLLATDAALWQRVALRGFRMEPGAPWQLRLTAFRMDGTLHRLAGEEEAATHTLALTDRDSGAASQLTWAEEGPERLVLEGTLEGQPVRLRLRKRAPESFPLLSRGFRWVSPAPYNR
jgi:uncharacterized membrane protein YphA (DoxX/SURF4 family)